MKKIWILPLLFLAVSCTRYQKDREPKLISVTISHPNGFSECINSKDRIGQYSETDFLKPQPYQKVARTYHPTKEGKNLGYLTSYYPSGQIKQYLEVEDGRAFGKYREWHPGGNLKLEVSVLGGVADLSSTAEKSWIFNGISKAFDEEGHLIAEIPYLKGALEGVSKYYSPGGNLIKTMPYKAGKLEGQVVVLDDCGKTLEKCNYHVGVLNGVYETYWPHGHLKSSEMYENGILSEGSYYNIKKEHVATIVEGYGCKAVFKDDYLEMLKTIKEGKEEGLVQTFNKDGRLARQYSLKNGMKDGEEIVFNGSRKLLSIRYRDGSIQGLTKTWYEDGTLESQREMFQNMKNGEMRAWYKNGNLMLIEEYQLDRLINGEYYKMGETKPVSKVIHGKGCATLYDADGNFLRKINYIDGKAQT